MAERVLLQWNLPNWITVVLMATFGVFFVGIILSYLRGYTGALSEDS